MLPADAYTLLSVVNTKLRDYYSSLKELCEDEDADMAELCAKLSSIGYAYDEEQNAFKSV